MLPFASMMLGQSGRALAAVSAFAGDFACRAWSGSATGPGAFYSSSKNKSFLFWVAETTQQTAKVVA